MAFQQFVDSMDISVEGELRHFGKWEVWSCDCIVLVGAMAEKTRKQHRSDVERCPECETVRPVIFIAPKYRLFWQDGEED